MRKKRICTDCLHCKVSAKSTEQVMLCTCGKIEKPYLAEEKHWADRKPCAEFEGMNE